MSPLALILAALAAALPAVLAFVPSGTPTYTDLKPYAGQWLITMQTSYDGGEWKLHTCNGTDIGAPCNQPAFQQDTKWRVRITFAKKNATKPFTTWMNATAEEIRIRLDYAPSVQVDRGWRKKNGAYPGYGKHVKWTLATIPFNSSGVGIWDLSNVDEVTDAVLYPEVCVTCRMADGSLNYCQCDRRNNATTNFLSIETKVMDDSITPEMRAATIALSIASPIFLILYSIGDWFRYKKTGKGLVLY